VFAKVLGDVLGPALGQFLGDFRPNCLGTETVRGVTVVQMFDFGLTYSCLQLPEIQKSLIRTHLQMIVHTSPFVPKQLALTRANNMYLRRPTTEVNYGIEFQQTYLGQMF
jgi:hypothetical protein